MNTAVEPANAPRPPAFKLATIVLVIINLFGIVLGLISPQTAQDMMVPWLRSFNMIACGVTASGLLMMWFRRGSGLYLMLGAQMLAAVVALMTGTHWIVLLIGLGVLVLYVFTLHVGGAYSMWRQMFGGVGLLRRNALPAVPNRPAPPRPSAPASAGAPAGATGSAVERLRQLASLRDAGAITAAEFEAKKTELLKQI